VVDARREHPWSRQTSSCAIHYPYVALCSNKCITSTYSLCLFVTNERKQMAYDLPRDPRLENVDNELVEIVFEEFKSNVDLVGIHLRDARNILYSLKSLKEPAVLSKAAILLACAALESNLAYLSKVAIRFGEKRPELYLPPQTDYLYGVQETIDERGEIVKKPIKQSLLERLEVVPSLLARAVKREYKLPVNSSPFKKLLRTIERRDAIVHPRWDKYVAQSGWW
jgi:hypothetical protein